MPKKDDNHNYEADLTIDPAALDEEWLEQPSLYGFYARELAHARRRRDRAHEKVKVVRSELILNAHKGKTTLGSKPTGPMVEAYYRNHKKHREAKDDLDEATFEVNIYEAAVFAFNQRKEALANLVRLHMAEYFHVEGLPKDLTDWKTRKDKAGETARKQRRGMTRTSKSKKS